MCLFNAQGFQEVQPNNALKLGTLKAIIQTILSGHDFRTLRAQIQPPKYGYVTPSQKLDYMGLFPGNQPPLNQPLAESQPPLIHVG